MARTARASEDGYCCHVLQLAQIEAQQAGAPKTDR